MEIESKWAAAKAIADPTVRGLALEIIFTEGQVAHLKENVEEARKAVATAASHTTIEGYAEIVEGWLRRFSNALTNLHEKEAELRALEHVRDASEHAAAIAAAVEGHNAHS